MIKRTFKGYHGIGYLLVATNIFGLMLGAEQASFARQPKRLLVVTVAKGFRHDSIPTVERVLQQLSEKSRSFTVDYARTDDELAAKTTTQSLRNYDGIVFAHTSGDLPLVSRQAFLDWIKAGHAFVGTHSATDTFKGFPEYIDMIGGQFESHGPQVSVQCHLEDPNHPATKGLRTSFTVFDEIYLFSKFNRANVHMLLALDQHPNTKQPGYYPLAWYRKYGKGRVFYTALGHRDDVLESDWFRQHLLGGIQWALGQAK
jgi:uncharacterized protein